MFVICIGHVFGGTSRTLSISCKLSDLGVVRCRIRETFELNQLKSAPSQLLPVFPGIVWLQTCCHSFGPANILYFFQVPADFFFIVMTTGPVFQCSKIMKCNNEAKASPVCHSLYRYKAYNGQITYTPRTKWYLALDESHRMRSAHFTIHLGKNPPPQNGCQLKSVFFF
jgi:hypothetical protein